MNQRIRGKRGGMRTLRKYGSDYFKRLSQLASAARKAKYANTQTTESN